MWLSRCLRGTEDIAKAVGKLRPLERMQQRTAEQAVSLNPRGRERVQQRTFEQVARCPGEDVEAVRFSTCEQVKHRTAGHVVHEPQSRQETVEVVRVVPREREQQHTAEQGVPQPRKEGGEVDPV